MPRVPLSDLDDPRVAIYHQLKRSNLTRDARRFVVEGEKLFDRLLESRFPLESVLASDRHAPRIEARVPDDVPLYVVPHSLLSMLVGFNFHRGVLACGLRTPWPDLRALVPPAGHPSVVVVCPALNNPENLGAIVRIGDVFGVDAIIAGAACPDPLSRRVLRVSMGTALARPVVVSEPLAADLAVLRDECGYTLVATVLDAAAESFEDLGRAGRVALLLGSESEGLDAQWVELCQRRVTIPMRPGAESLNVAVAAGILLYHVSRLMEAGGGSPADRSHDPL